MSEILQDQPGLTPDQDPGQGPGMGPDPAAGAEGQSRLMGALRAAGGAMREGALWTAPPAADALNKRTGIDAYDFAGGRQPELSEGQRVASGVLQYAGQRLVERMAERRQ